jgi:hypothetical protein
MFTMKRTPHGFPPRLHNGYNKYYGGSINLLSPISVTLETSHDERSALNAASLKFADTKNDQEQRKNRRYVRINGATTLTLAHTSIAKSSKRKLMKRTKYMTIPILVSKT